MKIAVACGGTGGHIFPGLATADVLRRRGHEVELWLGGRDVEGLSVEGWTGNVVRIRAAGFPTGLSMSSLLVIVRLLRAMAASRREMKTRRPDVLLAMGSYSSVGPVLAAHRLGVPVVLHEANAVPGRAIAFLSRYASAVGIAFTAAAAELRGARVERTGLPIRADLLSGPPERVGVKPGLFTVLVMGGSQGAHRVNQLSCEALCEAHRRGTPLQVVHLAGRMDAEYVKLAYEESGVSNIVFPFLKEMGKAYRVADLAISRAGASSCAELAIFGVPSLLIPFPTARRDHQTANARELERAGAADVRAESEVTAEWLTDYIEACRNDPGRLARMKQAMQSTAMPDAADRLATLVEQTGR